MLAQLSVVEPGNNMPFMSFQWDRSMDYMPGYELTELWMTENGLPKKGFWVTTYFSGGGKNSKGCKPVAKFRKALLQLVLIDEEEVTREKSRDDNFVLPLVGPNVILANPNHWVCYLAYNEADAKVYEDRKAASQ